MGYLITVEGGEFTGKSSVVVPILHSVCQRIGLPTIKSREPGGTPKGEEIRQQIFDRLRNGAQAEELAILFNEARKIHLDTVVRPFMQKHRNGVVILDRYCDSTFVYQGKEAGVPTLSLLSFHKKYTKNYFPDLTFLLHIPAHVFEKTLIERSQKPVDNSRSKTAWDESDLHTHLTRQKHYLSLPSLFKKHSISRSFVKINAAQEVEHVQKAVTRKLLNFLKTAPNQSARLYPVI